MANTFPSPNMGMQLPTPTVDPGPQYAIDNNTAFGVVDAHNHTAGSGVLVPVAGLNINADLPLNSNNLTLIRSCRFVNNGSVLSGTSDRGCIYEVNGDLYYNDSSGNQIRITASGAVNTSGSGSISGMTGTTATATYSSGSSLFTFSSNTSTPANFSTGPLTLGQNLLGTKTVTLTPSASQSANYSLTFPTALPVSSPNFIWSDTAGNLAFTALTRPLLPAVGQQVSSTCSAAITATSFTAITNASVTLTSTGRPVWIAYQPLSSSSATGVSQLNNTVASNPVLNFQLLRDGTQIAAWQINGTGVSVTPAFLAPWLDTGASATSHTYTLKAQVDATGRTYNASNMVLVAFEL